MLGGSEALEREMDRLGATAMVVARDGETILSHGAVERPVAVQSVRKSLLSALVGIAVDSGQLSLGTSLGELGIDDHPPLTDNEQSATVGDLLSARSGVYLPLPDEIVLPDRPTRGSHPPGTHWYYNNWDFNVLGNIYERATHKGVHVAFDHHLARRLGLQDWDLYEHGGYEYRSDPLGGNLTYANYTFALSARDLARFGQLYLNHGSWNGATVVPATWVHQSTQPIIATGIDAPIMRGYGRCWWVAGPGAESDAGIPDDAFTAWGLSGNFVTVIPSQHAVVVTVVDRDPSTAGAARPGFLSAADYSQALSRLIATL